MADAAADSPGLVTERVDPPAGMRPCQHLRKQRTAEDEADHRQFSHRFFMDVAHRLSQDAEAIFPQKKRNFVNIRRKAGGGGAAVFVSSVVADIGVAFHEAVAAAKGGLESLVLAAAATHARDQIRINAVRSGLMDSPAAAHILRNERARDLARQQYPLASLISPEEVAQALLYLLSAEQITGQILAVDGGFGAIRPLVTQ